jgi:hypothetical protein
VRFAVIVVTTSDDSTFSISLEPPHVCARSRVVASPRALAIFALPVPSADVNAAFPMSLRGVRLTVQPVTADSSVLESLEDSVSTFCFGDGKTFTAEMKQKNPPTVVDVLNHACKFLGSATAAGWDDEEGGGGGGGGDANAGGGEDDWDAPVKPAKKEPAPAPKKPAEPAASASKGSGGGGSAKDSKEKGGKGGGKDTDKKAEEEKMKPDEIVIVRSRSYKILPKEELAPVQREMIESLASKLSITISASAILLKQFRYAASARDAARAVHPARDADCCTV